MMATFEAFTAVAAPLPFANIDTDKILAGRFLKTLTRDGLGKKLFYDLRFAEDGSEIPTFILNRPPWRDAGVLIALDNFGCGSSREHAPWALRDFGIRCIIAPSFADIFFNSCYKNEILPVKLSLSAVHEIIEEVSDAGRCCVEIDLLSQTVETFNGNILKFEIDDNQKDRLMTGEDEISATLANLNKIASWEKNCAIVVPIIKADERLN